MKVLVDSSVWVAYFRGADTVPSLDWLIEEDLIATNDLILAELIPSLLMRGERKLASLLQDIERPALNLDWEGLIKMQVVCLRHGINKIGIPDLMIAQHAIQNELSLYSLDKHFALMSRHIPLVLQ